VKAHEGKILKFVEEDPSKRVHLTDE
jgi:hypothetical protein